MKLKREHCLLYAVTDRAWLRGQTLAQQAEAALRGGVTMVQLREKELEGDALEREAREILALCRQYGVPLLINDDVLLAEKIGADGVHVGQDDMACTEARRILGPDAIIGVTARTLEQAQAAAAAGADYLGSGAVFGTATKKDARPMDPAYFQKICESVPIPVVAIGGITADNIRKLKGRKMSGFAIVSGIFAAEDIEARTKQLWQEAQELCMEDAAGNLLSGIREKKPVVQSITNIVTVNDCANILLAAGATPTMAHHPDEMEEFASFTDALVCNMGATESLEAMRLAAAAAVKAGHPVVIDPVGSAFSVFRRGAAVSLIDVLHAQEKKPLLCIRGNAAEIRALAEIQNTEQGAGGEETDCEPSEKDNKKTGSKSAGTVSGNNTVMLGAAADAMPGAAADAMRLARSAGAVVIASGPVDYVTDGRLLYEIRGGSPWMARVTGTGCMLSALLGAFLAVEFSAYSAAACCRRMADCGEDAVRRTVSEKGGTGTYRIRMIDALSGPVTE